MERGREGREGGREEHSWKLRGQEQKECRNVMWQIQQVVAKYGNITL